MPDNTQPITNPTDNTVNPEPTGGNEGDWRTSISEDIRGQFDGIEGVDSLAKQFVELRGKITVPDEYNNEGIEITNEDANKNFQKFAKETGFTQAQYQALMKYGNEFEKRILDGVRQKTVSDFETALNEEKEAATKLLQDEWKGDYEKNLDVAHQALRKLADEEFVQYLEDTGLGNDARMIKLFHKLGNVLSEDQFIKSGTHDNDIPRMPDGKPRLRYPSMGDK